MSRIFVLLVSALLVACGDGRSPVDPVPVDSGGGVTPTPPRDPVALPVVGHGAVLDRYTAEVAVRDGYAYTTTWGNRGANPGNAIHIWDVRGATPQLVSSVHVTAAGTLGDVEVVDAPGGRRLLVVATEYDPGSLIVYDLADPALPVRLSRFQSANTRPGVHTAEAEVVNGRLYAFLSVNPGWDGSPARLVVVDLSDPATPRELFSQTMGRPILHDVFVRDGYLFTAEWDDGVGIWDIGAQGGSPEAPRRVSLTATVGGDVHNVWWYHDPEGGRRFLFVGQEGPGSVRSGTSSGDIHVLDVTDLAAPREVAFFHVTGAGTHNFSVDETRGILYAAYYNGGVRALDVRGDLGSCTDAQREAPGGRCDLGKMGREVARGLTDRAAFVWGVQQTGTSLFASDMHQGLFRLDLAPLHTALGR